MKKIIFTILFSTAIAAQSYAAADIAKVWASFKKDYCNLKVGDLEEVCKTSNDWFEFEKKAITWTYNCAENWQKKHPEGTQKSEIYKACTSQSDFARTIFKAYFDGANSKECSSVGGPTKPTPTAPK